MKKNVKCWFALILMLMLCLSLVSCSSADDEGEEMYDYVSHRTAELSFATEQVEKIYAGVVEAANAVNAKIESCDESYSSGKCTNVYVAYRVPSASLDQFINTISALGDLENKQIRTRNVSGLYASAESEKGYLTEQKAALEEMLNDEGLTTSERVELIDKIASITFEIEQIEQKLKHYALDDRESFVEVTIYEPTSPWVAFLIVAGFFFAQYIFPLLVVVLIVVIAKRRKKTSGKESVETTETKETAVEDLTSQTKQDML